MMTRLAVAVFVTASTAAALADDEVRGTASIYRDTRVACPGERYDPNAMTAAHRTLPCGTVVEIKNVKNGHVASVRIIDRGPFNNRIIDLTPAAALRAGFSEAEGLARVVIRAVLGFAARWTGSHGEFYGPRQTVPVRPVKITVIRPSLVK